MDKISDYIIDRNWHSFIEQAIKNCPPKSYGKLLNNYLDMGDSYKIKLSYIY